MQYAIDFWGYAGGLIALLKTAEDFAVNEVAPLVERDMKNAALGQVENVNGNETCEIQLTSWVDRLGQLILETPFVGRTEESQSDIMDQDSRKPSQKTVN